MPLPADASGVTTLTNALDASRAFEARVTTALAATVFDTFSSDLADALAAADPDWPVILNRPYLAAVRAAALTWLCRLGKIEAGYAMPSGRTD